MVGLNGGNVVEFCRGVVCDVTHLVDVVDVSLKAGPIQHCRELISFPITVLSNTL